MATYTQLSEEEAGELLGQFGLDVACLLPIARGSVNSNYRAETGSGRSIFVRIYEEQDREGAEGEARLLDHLARASVPTPRPLPRLDGRGFTVEHIGAGRSRPVAVFPWRAGEMLCQRLVTEKVAHAVGVALARTHLAGSDFPEKRAGRFELSHLRERLRTIAEAPSFELRSIAPRIADKLDEAARLRDLSRLPRGMIHGDLFRDNVLWDKDEITALLDFESASEGSFAYDLMVTALAWCYGDAFESGLLRALFAGYQSVRPLEAAERRALWVEGKVAALRFTITRLTDFEMRAGQGAQVMKDWRRFWARHAALEALGAEGLASLLE